MGRRASEYGTDKGPLAHDYTRWYEKHLPHASDEFTLLEIGVKDGASLRLWGEYFINARIIGVDIEPCKTPEGCEVYSCDQRELKLLLDKKHIVPDIIIDDGSHRWSDQIDTFCDCWPSIAVGGLYVIEDLHTSYLDAYGSNSGRSCIDFLKSMIDHMNLDGMSAGLGSMANEMRHNPQLRPDYFQRSVESITLYKSIAFIRKMERVV